MHLNAGEAASAHVIHVKYSTATFLKSLVSMFPCQYVEKFNICYHVTAAGYRCYRCLMSQHQHFPLPSFNKITLRSPARRHGGGGPQHWQRCMQWSTWIHSGYSGGEKHNKWMSLSLSLSFANISIKWLSMLVAVQWFLGLRTTAIPSWPHHTTISTIINGESCINLKKFHVFPKPKV